MLDGVREQLERQVARLLEEAERPMRVEEILPHLDPVVPTPNDVADVLLKLTEAHAVEREGSFYGRPTPVPVEALFAESPPATKHAADVVVQILREGGVEGVPYADVVRSAGRHGLAPDRVLDIVTRLKQTGEAFVVFGDRLRLAKA